MEPILNAKPFDINNYSTLPKGVGVTEIRNSKKGLDAFLKKGKADNLDQLKSQYFTGQAL